MENKPKVEIVLQKFGNSHVLIDGKDIPCTEIEIMPLNAKNQTTKARITILMPIVRVQPEIVEFIQENDRWHHLKRKIDFFLYDVGDAFRRLIK